MGHARCTEENSLCETYHQPVLRLIGTAGPAQVVRHGTEGYRGHCTKVQYPSWRESGLLIVQNASLLSKAAGRIRTVEMSTERKSVVVVDDDASINRALKRLLLAAGFNTETFSSAEDMLESGAAERAGCLVLDVRLPGISGFELSRKLSDAGTQTPVIFMTSHDEGEARQQAEKALAVAYLPKPFPGMSLVTAVTEALAIRHKGEPSTAYRAGRDAL